MIEKNIIIKTKSGNDYFYNIDNKIITYLHPILKYLILKYIDENSIDDISLNNDFNLSNYSGEDILYYKKKFNFLLKNDVISNNSSDSNFIPWKISGSEIKKSFIAGENITFEITESCNFNCEYCFYGKHYNQYEPRKNKNLSVESAKRIIDLKIKHWESDEYMSFDKIKLISFYGGEPLLYFSFIEEIVNYINNVKGKMNFRFQMTTNGSLLKKHIKFLVKNNFLISVSLDGDEYYNQYRVFKNGKSTFHQVFKNILYIKSNYKDFYDSNLSFLSVYHNKSNYVEIKDFFKNTFGIDNIFSEISEFGESIEKPSMDLFKVKKEYSPEEDVFLLFSRGAIYNYEELLAIGYRDKLFHTGTCIPFYKKTFITAQELILPCEQIPHKFTLGKMFKNMIDLDFDKAAAIYNKEIDNTLLQFDCKNCYLQFSCTSCIFKRIEGQKCEQYQSKKQIMASLSEFISQFE